MQIIRSLFPTILLSIIVLISTIDRVALAQSENSEMSQVEVPEAIGPDAMKALVSKLDGRQTAALVELIGLLNTSASNREILAAAENQGALETIKTWMTNFGASLKAHWQDFPEKISSAARRAHEKYAAAGTTGSS